MVVPKPYRINLCTLRESHCCAASIHPFFPGTPCVCDRTWQLHIAIVCEMQHTMVEVIAVVVYSSWNELLELPVHLAELSHSFVVTYVCIYPVKTTHKKTRATANSAELDSGGAHAASALDPSPQSPPPLFSRAGYPAAARRQRMGDDGCRLPPQHVKSVVDLTSHRYAQPL